MRIARPRRASTIWIIASPWRIVGTLLLLVVCAGLARLYAQTPAFRAGIDVVRVDAVVVDAKGMPIRGLTVEDFTVTEDGKPRPIVGFDAIDLPTEAEPGEAAWIRSAPRDVVTNKVEDRRLFMIIIDDAIMTPDLHAIARAKSIGRDVVSRLGPNDQAAVVFTQRSKKSQPFTSDHARLLAAIDSTTFGMDRRPETAAEIQGQREVASAWTVAQAAEALLLAPQHRKTLALISGGAAFAPETMVPVLSGMNSQNPMSANETATRILAELNRLFAAAARAHVTVYAFDVYDFGNVRADGQGILSFGRNFLRIVADSTGGRATIANEDPAQGVTQMFRESSVYYLIGFNSASGTPGRHRVDIQTRAPGARVLSRKTFEVAGPPAAAARTASPLSSSLASLLPVDSLPMRAAATALPGPTPGEAMVAIALGINQPAEGLDGGKERLTAQIEAYQTTGRLSGATKLDVQLALRPEISNRAQYELLAKLPLKPGRYQLRIAAHLPRLKVSGSVFADLEVPDFGRKGVVVAPLVLSTSPAPTAAPANAFAGLLPVVPTSHRSFGIADRVSVLARLVQGGRAPLGPLTVATSIVDTKNQRVFERTETVTPPAPAERRSADYTFALPIETLGIGDYLLTVKASTPDGTSERTLRFSRR